LNNKAAQNAIIFVHLAGMRKAEGHRVEFYLQLRNGRDTSHDHSFMFLRDDGFAITGFLFQECELIYICEEF
jgi:hypothetical protein